ncbi:hypothetical protein CS022_24840, partial [Veronia nyctiphanis]
PHRGRPGHATGGAHLDERHPDRDHHLDHVAVYRAVGAAGVIPGWQITVNATVYDEAGNSHGAAPVTVSKDITADVDDDFAIVPAAPTVGGQAYNADDVAG